MTSRHNMPRYTPRQRCVIKWLRLRGFARSAMLCPRPLPFRRLRFRTRERSARPRTL